MKQRSMTRWTWAALVWCALNMAAHAQASATRDFASLMTPHPATIAGQSATQLPDGRWLLLGGHGKSTLASTDAAIVDPATGKTTALSTHMAQARTGHSATLLPDGSVIVLGGQDAQGQIVITAEQFDPASGRFQSLGDLGLIARSGHTANVLADGKLLIAGGSGGSRGQALYDAELVNPLTRQSERFNARLSIARLNQLAAVLPGANVLLWGGINNTRQALNTGEVYDPVNQNFTPVSTAIASQLAQGLNRTAPPGIQASQPAADAPAAPINQPIVVQFTQRMRVATLSNASVTLIGPQGAVPVKPMPVEYGVLLFVTPTKDLLPATRYTLFIDGATDEAGQRLPFTAIGFTTAQLAAQGTPNDGVAPITNNTFSSNGKAVITNAPASQSVVEDETWIPQARNYHGEWTSGRAALAGKFPPRRVELQRGFLLTELQRDGRVKPEHRESRMPPIHQTAAAPGVTALVGQALRLNGLPLAGVTVRMGSQKTVTDDNGEFLLTNIPDGSPVLEIDGSTASTPQRSYGRYFYQIHIKPGIVNAMRQPIWMVKLDTQHAIRIPSPTTKETVISNPLMPGLEIHLPAGTVIRNADGKIVTEVTLTPVPSDQLPFPMPYGDVPVYYTLQPGGAMIQSVSGKPQGATVVYPNYSTQQPGAKFELFDYDPYGRGWYVYSNATISADGKRIISDKPFVLYQFSASSAASSGGTPAGKAPTCQGGVAGDPVTCHGGIFLEGDTDLALAAAMPVELTRSYHSGDTNQRSFGIGASHNYDMYLYLINTGMAGNGFTATQIDLVLGNGGRIPFTPAAGSNIYSKGSVYQSLTPGKFYMAKLSTPGEGLNFQLTLKDGTVYTFSYYQSSLIAVQDRWGNSIGLTRDNNRRILQITASNGRRIAFQYNEPNCSSCITQAMDNIGRQVSYQYDPAGRLAQVTDATGGITTYTYDAAHHMLTVRDPRNNAGEVVQPKVTNVYYTQADSANLNERVKQQTYADGSTNYFAYTFDSNNLVTRTEITNERGYIRRIDYTPQGQIAKETLATGTPQQQVTTNVWDSTTNLLTSTTDSLNRTTVYTYDVQGNVLSVTYLAGTANALTSTYTYTGTWNQIASITDALNNTSNLTYDALGNLTQIQDPSGKFTYRGYNSTGQITSVTDALGKVTTFSYDGSDLVQTTDALNRSIGFSSDAVGRITAVTDPLGNRSTTTYGSLDVDQQADAMGKGIAYNRDANGNLTRVTNARGYSHQFAYDSRNATSSRTDPLNQSDSYQYDANHNLTQNTDRKGQVTQYTYDALDRLQTITYADTSTVNYTYDAGNRVTQIVDSSNGTITDTWDDLDRLTQQTTPKGSVSYTYYANGLRKTMTVSGLPTLTYTYDANNRLTRIDQAAGAANNNTAQAITFSYDDANRRTQTKLANGQTVNYGYDDANQLTSIVYKNADGSTVGDLNYTYDKAGRRTQITGSLARTNLPTDASSTGIDAANRLTTRNGQNLAYDLNGNLTSDGVNTYTWNARNQLVQISGGTTASFTYDALGRRQTKTISGIGTGYVYDGINPVQELNGTTVDNSVPANVRASYLTGLSVDEVFAQQTGTGASAQLNSYFTDALGSTIRLTDNTGNKLVDYTYDPYGNTTADATISNPFQYTGRENDQTGLYYYRARYYSPTLQRFISQDPIGLGGGINEYIYVNGNPISLSDPLGLDPHTYSWPVYRCLGNCVAQTMDELRHNPAPGVNLDKPVQSGDVNTVNLGPKTLGPIKTTVDECNNSITNTTMPGHMLYPGWVTRQVTFDGQATWVTSTGGGDGPYPWLNSILAPIVWGGTTPMRRP